MRIEQGSFSNNTKENNQSNDCISNKTVIMLTITRNLRKRDTDDNNKNFVALIHVLCDGVLCVLRSIAIRHHHPLILSACSSSSS